MAVTQFGRSGAVLAGFVALGLLAGCDGRGFEQDFIDPSSNKRVPGRNTSEPPPESLFGKGGLDLLGLFASDESSPSAGIGIGVNGFLWRASLDTISFMPLSSADPFGGVIITDWYTPPEAPAERFKMNVYILGRQLRADGVRVAVFRQAKAGSGQWADASVGSDTSVNLENQILTRARQLRVASATK